MKDLGPKSGILYEEGLKGIAEKEGVSIIDAAEIARQDAEKGLGYELIPYINAAEEKLVNEASDS